MITSEHVEAYRRDGYLVVPDLVPAATLDAIRRELARLVDAARGVADHDDVYDLEPSHRPDAPRVRRIKKPHRINPGLFWELARSPAMVEVLSALLGPAIRLHGSKLNLKSPLYGSPVEWHQDWAFYPHTNDDVLAVGVMLEDIDMENGPMMVVPGTHKGPIHDHHVDGVFCGAMDPVRDGVDIGAAVPVMGRAGAVSFHHARLVHGSAQNTSTRPRPFLLYEFTAADAWPLMGVPSLDEFNSRMIVGQPTLTPRLEVVPVRMPLPPARSQGSIYENQTALPNRWFKVDSEAGEPA